VCGSKSILQALPPIQQQQQQIQQQQLIQQQQQQQQLIQQQQQQIQQPDHTRAGGQEFCDSTIGNQMCSV